MKKWDKWITLAPIALVLAFLPLVVGRINSKTYTENEPWLSANAVESDFFLYGKLFVLFFCCLFMIVCVFGGRFMKFQSTFFFYWDMDFWRLFRRYAQNTLF